MRILLRLVCFGVRELHVSLRVQRRLTVLLVMLGSVTTYVSAQATPPDTVPKALRALSAFARSSSVSTITGPTMCAVVAEHAEVRANFPATAQRQWLTTWRWDTLPLAPRTVQIARACLARWTLQNTPSFERPALLRLALLANRDTLAHQIAHTWATEGPVTDTVLRAERWYQILHMYWGTRPRINRRIQDGDRALDSIVALGPGAMPERVWALRESAFLGSGIDSLSWNEASVDALLQTIHDIPVRKRAQYHQWYEVEGVVQKFRAFLLTSRGGFKDSSAAQRYRALLTQMRHEYADDPFMRDVLDNAPQTLEEAVLQGKSRSWTMNVHPARPLHAQYWFNRPDHTGSLPRPGVMSVIVSFDRNCGGACYDMYAAYRRLYEEFAPRGVQFIVMTQTAGYIGSLRLTSRAEADSLRAYFLDQLQLPGILGIEESTADTLPDGRIQMHPTTNDLPSKLHSSSWMHIVLKSGLVIPTEGMFIGAVIPSLRGEATIRRLINDQL